VTESFVGLRQRANEHGPLVQLQTLPSFGTLGAGPLGYESVKVGQLKTAAVALTRRERRRWFACRLASGQSESRTDFVCFLHSRAISN